MINIDPAEVKRKYQKAVGIFISVSAVVVICWFFFGGFGNNIDSMKMIFRLSLLIVAAWLFLQSYFGLKYEMLGNIFIFPRTKNKVAKYSGMVLLFLGVLLLLWGFFFI